MSSTAIINRIEKESSLEISGIPKQAEEECEQIRGAGRQKADLEYDRIVKAGGRVIHQEISELKSQMRIEARNKVRITREKLITRSFEEAARELQDIRSQPEYPDIFFRLCEEGRLILETDTLLITIDQRDRLLADAIASKYAKTGITMTFTELQGANSGGMIIHRSDGAYVDNTVETRLERERRDLLIEIAEVLFQKDSPR
ncbi:MAG: V-type ATP synthase subunit E family protein [Methanobacteriota archaeon]